MATLRRNKEEADIKKVATFTHLPYNSALSLYHLMKKAQDTITLSGILVGDEKCVAEAKEKYNYYGKLKIHAPETPEDQKKFKEAVEDVGLIVWAFKKIGDRDRIEAAVHTAMSMFSSNSKD